MTSSLEVLPSFVFFNTARELLPLGTEWYTGLDPIQKNNTNIKSSVYFSKSHERFCFGPQLH